MSFDLWTTVRAYRTLLDAEDRTMAAGPPFLLLDGRRQPPVTPLAHSVAMAVALSGWNEGVSRAVAFPSTLGHQPRKVE